MYMLQRLRLEQDWQAYRVNFKRYTSMERPTHWQGAFYTGFSEKYSNGKDVGFGPQNDPHHRD